MQAALIAFAYLSDHIAHLMQTCLVKHDYAICQVYSNISAGCMSNTSANSVGLQHWQRLVARCGAQ